MSELTRVMVLAGVAVVVGLAVAVMAFRSLLRRP